MNETTKKCVICDEDISINANKCVHCDSYQGWKRFLNLSSNILSLLVALVAVLGITIPVFKAAFETEYTNIIGTISSRETGLVNGDKMDFFNILLTNTGTTGGAVSEVYIFVHDKKIRARLPTKFMERHDYFITPGKTVVLPFYIKPGEVVESEYEIVVSYIGHDNIHNSVEISR